MNIKEAKAQIKNAMTAYFSKDEFGRYVIPTEKQRPVFLMGPPGIGKTAIMEQIAAELGVGLISYSMTHHTRQSALGLPFIVKKNYGGKEYNVSEYTMSEIIASVYDMIETTGHKEGILFLDEINCVSETLAPTMLQFLQYKIFGRHKVPDGWVVVTAGNPPEYNNSVREFDIVTWDRLKRIDVEPDYDVWKEYAVNRGIHTAITTYLDTKKSDFYRIEMTVDGKSFVTARGWSDLSDIIKLYEQNGITVDEKLISQYLQRRKTAKEFAVYYDLFNKYKSDYQVDAIITGNASEEIKNRARNAEFDERLALLGLIIEAICHEVKSLYIDENVALLLISASKDIKDDIISEKTDCVTALKAIVESKENEIGKSVRSSSVSPDDLIVTRRFICLLENTIASMIKSGKKIGFPAIKKVIDEYTAQDAKKVEVTDKHISNAFLFCEEVFGEDQEMLILVTELTINNYAARFIGRYGNKEYFKHNKDLLFYERQKDIMQKIQSINHIEYVEK